MKESHVMLLSFVLTFITIGAVFSLGGLEFRFSRLYILFTNGMGFLLRYS
jgi:hypothetical protein